MFWCHRPSSVRLSSRVAKPSRTILALEGLEPRYAPATLVNPRTLTYQDVDGDQVQVQISKPLFQAATINNVFTFAAGSVNGNNTARQQLQTIDLTDLAAEGISLTVTATRHGGGDGLASVGFINAAGFNLKDVSVQGNLGRIDAGVNLVPYALQGGRAGNNGAGSTGLMSLAVNSLGQGYGGAPDAYLSHILGNLGLLEVKADVRGSILVIGATGVDGKIGRVQIGGSLIGCDADGSGVISATGAIGPVEIKGNIRGGAGFDTGVVRSAVQIGDVTLGGSLIGGSGSGSGLILSGIFGGGGGGYGIVIAAQAGPASSWSGSGIGKVTIKGDVRGGDGFGSGAIVSVHRINGVSIGGSLLGGAGDQSGQIITGTGQHFGGGYGLVAQVAAQAGPGGDCCDCGLGPVTIKGDIRGGEGFQSGAILDQSLCPIDRITVGGSLLGGAGFASGQIFSNGDIGPILIHGDVSGSVTGSVGGDAEGLQSGTIVSEGRIASVTVDGSLIGGEGSGSGQIVGGGSSRGVPAPAAIGGFSAETTDGQVTGLGPVTIKGDIRGGRGFNSGIVSGTGQVASVLVGGSLIGGEGGGSGQILLNSGSSFGGPPVPYSLTAGPVHGPSSETGLATVVIKHDVQGGTGFNSGVVFGSALSRVTVGGSLLGGSGDGSGQVSNGQSFGGGYGVVFAPSFSSGGELGDVTIKGDVRGGSGQGSGVLGSTAAIGRVTVGGSLLGGEGFASGQISSQGAIGPVDIKGDVRGGVGDNSGVIHSGGAIASIMLGGSLLGGDSFSSGWISSDGSMGQVKIKGDVRGGRGIASGAILSAGGIAGIDLAGSLVGGQANGSGQISGGILEFGPEITTLAAGTHHPGDQGGRSLGSVTIKGDILGGEGIQSGAIFGFSQLTCLTVGGSVRAGSGDHSASIQADQIDTITIHGSLIGTSVNPVVIIARGHPIQKQTMTVTILVQEVIRVLVVVRVPTPDCGFTVEYREEERTITRYDFETIEVVVDAVAGKIEHLTVDRGVKFAQVVAGPGGQIGTIKVGGDWSASSAAAGIDPGEDGQFGTGDDTVATSFVPGTISKIARIEIGGKVSGTPAAVDATDHYGFVAQHIGALTVGRTQFRLNRGPDNDDFALGTTGDFRLREL